MDRKNSDKRSGSDANLSDIFDAIHILDQDDAVSVCLAKNLDALLNNNPEELNLLAVIWC